MKKIALLAALALGASLMTASAKAAPTVLTAQKVIRSTTAPTGAQYIDVTNGNKIYLLTDGVFLRLSQQASAANTTITVTDQFTSAQGYSTPIVVTAVAAAGPFYVGPFKKSRWADGAGYLQISAVGSTQTAVEVLRLPIGEQDAFTK